MRKLHVRSFRYQDQTTSSMREVELSATDRRSRIGSNAYQFPFVFHLQFDQVTDNLMGKLPSNGRFHLAICLKHYENFVCPPLQWGHSWRQSSQINFLFQNMK